jgi:hypothetical protein
MQEHSQIIRDGLARLSRYCKISMGRGGVVGGTTSSSQATIKKIKGNQVTDGLRRIAGETTVDMQRKNRLPFSAHESSSFLST